MSRRGPARRELDPVAALDDVIRWVETTLSPTAEEVRDASLVREAILVARRLESAKEALERVKGETEARGGGG